MRKRLRLDLGGNFRLCDETGNEIPVRTARARALLAILATSRYQKRTRGWLQACLWEASPEEQASGSLRQLLSVLRKTLGERSDLLETDRTYVGMPKLETAEGEGTFFEDAPDLGETFEDWLRMERAARDVMAVPGEPPPVTRRARPCLVIAAPQVLSADPTMGVIAGLVCDRTMDGLRAHSMVDLFDLRDLGANQLALFPVETPPSPDAVFLVRASDVASERHITVSLLRPRDQRILWTHTGMMEMHGGGASPTFDWAQDIVGRAIEAVHAALFSHPFAGFARTPPPEGQRVFAAAHQLLGMSRSGHGQARDLLRRRLDGPEPTGMAHAWYAFSFANVMGERIGEIDGVFFEEAEEHCRRALECDPTNGLVLALVAHVYGFVMRRQDAAAELARLARDAAPDLPLVWDLSAMNAIYRDDAEAAHGHSLVAQRLGRFSPYKPLFDSSVSISATLTGRHQLAIRTAEALLQRRSGFLAAMRYLTVSLVADGRTDEARRIADDVRLRDPNFRAETIGSQDYPLPSATSRELIGAALARL